MVGNPAKQIGWVCTCGERLSDDLECLACERGLIKAFEYTFELAWTTLKDFLEYRGQSGIYGSRDAIRKAFQLNLIDDGENWMDMLISRNRTSHTYNKETADEICRAVKKVYFSLFQEFDKKMGQLKMESEQA